MNDYDYDDDSDLEETDAEDDEDDILEDKPTATPSIEEPVGAIQVATEELGDGFDDVVSIGSSDAKSTGSSDISSVSDLDSLSSVSSDAKDEGETGPFAHVGKVVVIEDVAFITLVGFVSSW